MAEQHDDEGRRESDDVAGGLGCPEALQRGFHEVSDRGFGDNAQRRGRNRDAQLADREHEGDVLQRIERILGAARSPVSQRLDLGSARRGDRELAGHEEGVDRKQRDGDCQAHAGAHSSSSVSSAGAGVIATCATLRPCI